MKKEMIFILFSMMMLFSVFVVADDFSNEYGTHFKDAVESNDLNVGIKQSSIIPAFEIGSYKETGSFSVNFLPSEIVYLKYDEESWNTKCSKTFFTVEVYSPKGFVKANSIWLGAQEKSIPYIGSMSYTLGTDEGTWIFVDYVWCESQQKIISVANKISISVKKSVVGKICETQWVGAETCSDGDVKRNWQTSDCNKVELKTVYDCTSDEFCDANSVKCLTVKACRNQDGICPLDLGCTPDNDNDCEKVSDECKDNDGVCPAKCDNTKDSDCKQLSCVTSDEKYDTCSDNTKVKTWECVNDKLISTEKTCSSTPYNFTTMIIALMVIIALYLGYTFVKKR